MAAVNKNGVCAVLCAGKVRDFSLLASRLNECDCLICADAGYVYAKRCGRVPDAVIGDFDSAEKPQAGSVLTFPVRKDETDAQLAVSYAVSLGYTEIYLLAATGGRLDHTYANIVFAANSLSHGIHVVLLDEQNRVSLEAPGKLTLQKNGYNKLSLFSFGGTVTGLTTTGVSYPLTDYTLDSTNPLGVSNEIVCNEAEIFFKSGTLLIIQSND